MAANRKSFLLLAARQYFFFHKYDSLCQLKVQASFGP